MFCFKKNDLLLAVLGLCCCTWASHCYGFSCGAWALGCLSFVIPIPRLRRTGSVVAHRFSCSITGRIFPDQGSNPCLLHWQADPLTTEPPGKPLFSFLTRHRELLSQLWSCGLGIKNWFFFKKGGKVTKFLIFSLHSHLKYYNKTP